jgi:hypothetical protein
MVSGGSDWSRSARYDFGDDDTVKKKTAKQYAQDAGTEYKPDKATGLQPPVGVNISTRSILVMPVMLDITGSMKKVPEDFITKTPALYEESNAVLQGFTLEELKQKKIIPMELEMAVIAIGDARGDKYPLQVVGFGKGTDLAKEVNKIFPEGNGGGNLKESYDLGIYFLLNHCKIPKMPKGIKPLFVILGDEGFYTTVDKRHVKSLMGDTITTSIDTAEMIREAAKKYDIHILRPEMNYGAEEYAEIHKQWQAVLGEERVLKMKRPDRFVDDIVVMCGYHSDHYESAMQLLERRQVDTKNPKPGLDKMFEVLDTLHPMLGAKKVKEEKERLGDKYHK